MWGNQVGRLSVDVLSCDVGPDRARLGCPAATGVLAASAATVPVHYIFPRGSDSRERPGDRGRT